MRVGLLVTVAFDDEEMNGEESRGFCCLTLSLTFITACICFFNLFIDDDVSYC